MAFILSKTRKERKRHKHSIDQLVHDLLEDIKFNLNYSIQINHLEHDYKKKKRIQSIGYMNDEKIMIIKYGKLKVTVQLYYEDQLIFTLLYLGHTFTNLVHITYYYQKQVILEERYSIYNDQHQELKKRKYYYHDLLYKQVNYNFKERPISYRYFASLEAINMDDEKLISIASLDQTIDLSSEIIKLNKMHVFEYSLDTYQLKKNIRSIKKSKILKKAPEFRITPNKIDQGLNIHSIYLRSGKRCVDACFDEHGIYQYVNENNEPYMIEVPQDVYDEALHYYKQKIKEGAIPSIQDEHFATSYMKQGKYTYHQAYLLAKSNCVESVEYDEEHDQVISTSPICISSAIDYAFNLWSGRSNIESLIHSALTELKIGGEEFFRFFNKYPVRKKIIVIKKMKRPLINYKKLIKKNTTSFLSRTFQIHYLVRFTRIQFITVLRRNLITSILTVIVVSTTDVKHAVKGRISKIQAIKNITRELLTLLGSAIGAAVFILYTPHYLDFIQFNALFISILGGVLGAILAAIISTLFLNIVIKDDKKHMLNIIETEMYALCHAYLLTKYEIKLLKKELRKVDSKFTLQQMYSISNRQSFANHLILIYLKKIINQRPYINMQPYDQYKDIMMQLLKQTSS